MKWGSFSFAVVFGISVYIFVSGFIFKNQKFKYHS